MTREERAESDRGTEQYEDAMCPDCGTVLTGAREPGDEDYCQDTMRDVVLVSPDEERNDRSQNTGTEEVR